MLFLRWKDNLIVLEGMSLVTTDDSIKLVEYSTYSLGKNVKHHVKTTEHVNISIDVSPCTHRFVGIVTKYDDVVKKLFPNLEIVPQTAKYIVLALATVTDTSKHECLFHVDTLPESKSCMHNTICKTTNHFNSRGNCFSFGLHGLFNTKPDLTTIGNYSKKKKNQNTMISYQKLMSYTIRSLQTGFDAICKLMNESAHRVIVSCKTHLIKEIKKRHLLIVNDIEDTMYPFLSAHLNINVSTETFHTEGGFSHTFVYFPHQENGPYIHGMMNFLFRLSDNVQLQFNMCEGFGIFYSAMLLTHRQDRVPGKYNGNDIINVSAYTNKRSYACFRHSVQRGLSL